jgi:hypothetical protein
LAQKRKGDHQPGEGGHHQQDGRRHGEYREEQQDLDEDGNLLGVLGLVQTDLQGGQGHGVALAGPEKGESCEQANEHGPGGKMVISHCRPPALFA